MHIETIIQKQWPNIQLVVVLPWQCMMRTQERVTKGKEVWKCIELFANTELFAQKNFDGSNHSSAMISTM